jgi:hypothetical protein
MRRYMTYKLKNTNMKEKIEFTLPNKNFYDEDKVKDILRESISLDKNIKRIETNKIRDNIFDITLEFEEDQNEVKIRSMISNHTDVESINFID